MITDKEILEARILIVDDQAINVSLLEGTLQGAGYVNVSSTMDPFQVAMLHATHGYDLIVLDLQMPGMDGFQVMDMLKASEPGRYLPVLVVTAQPGHKLRALQAGAKDFVTKPFDLVELKTRIYNMLEVRLLYRELESQNQRLEHAVAERTAELLESEARYRNLANLASDWYWEQDETGKFTQVNGPVMEMLGLGLGAETTGAAPAGEWDATERAALQAAIDARQPFLDFVFSRVNPDGSHQKFRVSGEPIFGPACSFLGYRGVGHEIRTGN
jgi:PAS domain S-box-containing protein